MQLLRNIKLLETQLGYMLKVFHVPGKTMIVQGTDRLSRGVMVHPLTGSMGIQSLQLLFPPAIPSKCLLVWALDLCGVTSSSPWQFRSDLDNWRRSLLIDKCTLWTISPQFTVQAMLEAVQSWIEQRFSASHIFIVPGYYKGILAISTRISFSLAS